MRPETASVLTNVMKGVIERGTGARARVLKRPVAGKTGTSSEATDVWFVGFTPNLVAGVWIGYDVKRSLGSADTGGRLALPLWISFMEKALSDLPPDDFPVPENVVAIPVNYMTGRPVPREEKGAILEYFIKGTEPAPLEAKAPPVFSPSSVVPTPVATTPSQAPVTPADNSSPGAPVVPAASAIPPAPPPPISR
jgi:penicillin-binding protein 1A